MTVHATAAGLDGKVDFGSASAAVTVNDRTALTATISNIVGVGDPSLSGIVAGTYEIPAGVSLVYSNLPWISLGANPSLFNLADDTQYSLLLTWDFPFQQNQGYPPVATSVSQSLGAVPPGQLTFRPNSPCNAFASVSGTVSVMSITRTTLNVYVQAHMELHVAGVHFDSEHAFDLDLVGPAPITYVGGPNA